MADGNEELEKHLLSWYSEVLNRRVDLVGDYAGNELFLIEGDSLLLHSFSTSEVDLHSKPDHRLHNPESLLRTRNAISNLELTLALSDRWLPGASCRLRCGEVSQ